MPDITTSSDDDIKKFLAGKMKASGLSLEDEVAKILQARQYTVRRNVPFYDMDEPKSRAIEIVGHHFFPDDKYFKKGVLHSIAQLALVIECKNISGNIWVFSMDNLPSFSFPEFASMNYGQKDPALNVMPLEPIQNVTYVSGYDEFIFDDSKSNKKLDNLYSAIHTVTKATLYLKESFNENFKKLKNWRPKNQDYILHFVFFQSTIIFNGKMYVKYDNNGHTEFKPVEYVQMEKSYISKDNKSSQGMIHIISSESLENYLKMVELYYRAKENIIIKQQPKLLQALNLS